ncbi:MAG: DJ-1/PfpI family protein [Bacteroidetes bacterium]|jgi:DJ-1 family protein|nr:DJ-1/PfpI family protein [Bacteroidota bacterium]
MKALVPIANGTEEMEAVIIIDMLRRAGIDVIVAGDGNVVTCSRGVRIVPDCQMEDLSDDENFDAIVLPGGSQGVQNFIENAQLEHMLQRHRERKGVIGAICAAPVVLHELNMLARTAVITSHPSVAETLQGYAYTLERVAQDGRLITSRGAGTAFEFTLAVIRMMVDEATASRVASDIVLYE